MNPMISACGFVITDADILVIYDPPFFTHLLHISGKSPLRERPLTVILAPFVIGGMDLPGGRMSIRFKPYVSGRFEEINDIVIFLFGLFHPLSRSFTDCKMIILFYQPEKSLQAP